VLVELLERDVDRLRQVLVCVFVRRQNFDESRLLLAEEALDFVTVDRDRHFGSWID
jgi:hypothetical protein